MSIPGTSPPIVVGTDGSPSSLHAVRWAAEEASRVGAPLRIVHAYLAPRAMHLAYSLTDPGEMHSSLRQQAEQWTRAAFLAAMEAAPLIRPEVDLRTAEPIS